MNSFFCPHFLKPCKNFMVLNDVRIKKERGLLVDAHPLVFFHKVAFTQFFFEQL